MSPTKHTYTAKFSNGRSYERKSIRAYTHAYLLTRNDRVCTIGFATNLERAQHALRGDNTRYQDGAGTVEFVETVQT